MPISLDEFSNPRWIKYIEGYPISPNKQDRFNEINPMHFAGRYPGSIGREGGWKEAGYNPNHQRTVVEHINVRSDDITLLPY
jgi:hypothetical protein